MESIAIKDLTIHRLHQNIDDKEKRIAVTYVLTIDDTDHTITNVHFSNKDEPALLHLKEVLALTSDEGIIAGDFNIHGYNMTTYKDIYGPKYVSSYDLQKYISFPSQGNTFDYVLASQSFLMEKVICREENLSDHRMLLVSISAQ